MFVRMIPSCDCPYPSRQLAERALNDRRFSPVDFVNTQSWCDPFVTNRDVMSMEFKPSQMGGVLWSRNIRMRPLRSADSHKTVDRGTAGP